MTDRRPLIDPRGRLDQTSPEGLAAWALAWIDKASHGDEAQRDACLDQARLCAEQLGRSDPGFGLALRTEILLRRGMRVAARLLTEQHIDEHPDDLYPLALEQAGSPQERLDTIARGADLGVPSVHADIIEIASTDARRAHELLLILAERLTDRMERHLDRMRSWGDQRLDARVAARNLARASLRALDAAQQLQPEGDEDVEQIARRVAWLCDDPELASAAHQERRSSQRTVLMNLATFAAARSYADRVRRQHPEDHHIDLALRDAAVRQAMEHPSRPDARMAVDDAHRWALPHDLDGTYRSWVSSCERAVAASADDDRALAEAWLRRIAEAAARAGVGDGWLAIAELDGPGASTRSSHLRAAAQLGSERARSLLLQPLQDALAEALHFEDAARALDACRRAIDDAETLGHHHVGRFLAQAAKEGALTSAASSLRTTATDLLLRSSHDDPGAIEVLDQLVLAAAPVEELASELLPRILRDAPLACAEHPESGWQLVQSLRHHGTRLPLEGQRGAVLDCIEQVVSTIACHPRSSSDLRAALATGCLDHDQPHLARALAEGLTADPDLTGTDAWKVGLRVLATLDAPFGDDAELHLSALGRHALADAAPRPVDREDLRTWARSMADRPLPIPCPPLTKPMTQRTTRRVDRSIVVVPPTATARPADTRQPSPPPTSRQWRPRPGSPGSFNL